MAKKDPEESSEETLTEEQRITLLEKSVSLNKIIMLIIAVIMIIGLSVGITSVIINALTDQPEAASPEKLAALEKTLAEIQTSLSEQKLEMTKIAKAQEALKTQFANGSAPVFQRVLLKQEESYQAFMKNMKSGMYDLARMIPGSRTWLEMYNEELEKQTAHSQQRQRDLQRLQTGEPLIEP